MAGRKRMPVYYVDSDDAMDDYASDTEIERIGIHDATQIPDRLEDELLLEIGALRIGDDPNDGTGGHQFSTAHTGDGDGDGMLYGDSQARVPLPGRRGFHRIAAGDGRIRSPPVLSPPPPAARGRRRRERSPNDDDVNVLEARRRLGRAGGGRGFAGVQWGGQNSGMIVSPESSRRQSPSRYGPGAASPMHDGSPTARGSPTGQPDGQFAQVISALGGAGGLSAVRRALTYSSDSDNNNAGNRSPGSIQDLAAGQGQRRAAVGRFAGLLTVLDDIEGVPRALNFDSSSGADDDNSPTANTRTRTFPHTARPRAGRTRRAQQRAQAAAQPGSPGSQMQRSGDPYQGADNRAVRIHHLVSNQSAINRSVDDDPRGGYIDPRRAQIHHRIPRYPPPDPPRRQRREDATTVEDPIEVVNDQRRICGLPPIVPPSGLRSRRHIHGNPTLPPAPVGRGQRRQPWPRLHAAAIQQEEELPIGRGDSAPVQRDQNAAYGREGLGPEAVYHYTPEGFVPVFRGGLDIDPVQREQHAAAVREFQGNSFPELTIPRSRGHSPVRRNQDAAADEEIPRIIQGRNDPGMPARNVHGNTQINCRRETTEQIRRASLGGQAADNEEIQRIIQGRINDPGIAAPSAYDFDQISRFRNTTEQIRRAARGGQAAANGEIQRIIEGRNRTGIPAPNVHDVADINRHRVGQGSVDISERNPAGMRFLTGGRGGRGIARHGLAEFGASGNLGLIAASEGRHVSPAREDAAPARGLDWAQEEREAGNVNQLLRILEDHHGTDIQRPRQDIVEPPQGPAANIHEVQEGRSPNMNEEGDANERELQRLRALLAPHYHQIREVLRLRGQDPGGSAWLGIPDVQVEQVLEQPLPRQTGDPSEQQQNEGLEERRIDDSQNSQVLDPTSTEQIKDTPVQGEAVAQPGSGSEGEEDYFQVGDSEDQVFSQLSPVRSTDSFEVDEPPADQDGDGREGPVLSEDELAVWQPPAEPQGQPTDERVPLDHPWQNMQDDFQVYGDSEKEGGSDEQPAGGGIWQPWPTYPVDDGEDDEEGYDYEGDPGANDENIEPYLALELVDNAGQEVGHPNSPSYLPQRYYQPSPYVDEGVEPVTTADRPFNTSRDPTLLWGPYVASGIPTFLSFKEREFWIRQVMLSKWQMEKDEEVAAAARMRGVEIFAMAGEDPFRREAQIRANQGNQVVDFSNYVAQVLQDNGLPPDMMPMEQGYPSDPEGDDDDDDEEEEDDDDDDESLDGMPPLEPDPIEDDTDENNEGAETWTPDRPGELYPRRTFEPYDKAVRPPEWAVRGPGANYVVMIGDIDPDFYCINGNIWIIHPGNLGRGRQFPTGFIHVLRHQRDFERMGIRHGDLLLKVGAFVSAIGDYQGRPDAEYVWDPLMAASLHSFVDLNKRINVKPEDYETLPCKFIGWCLKFNQDHDNEEPRLTVDDLAPSSTVRDHAIGTICTAVFRPQRGDLIILPQTWEDNFDHQGNFRRSMLKWYKGPELSDKFITDGTMVVRLCVDREFRSAGYKRMGEYDDPLKIYPLTHPVDANYNWGRVELFMWNGTDWLFWGRDKLRPKFHLPSARRCLYYSSNP